jgi:DNA-binding transcriptional ArsR family regulator
LKKARTRAFFYVQLNAANYFVPPIDKHIQITNYIVMKTIVDIPHVWKNISDLFIALGDEQRQRILLSFDKNERLNIMQIVASSKLGRTAVTHHLKVLHHSGALQSEKIGKEVFFWINKDAITENIQTVLNYIREEI